MQNLAYNEDFDNPYELLDGKFIAMSPRPSVNHNVVSSNILYIFKSFLNGKPCMSFSDGVDVHLTDKDIVVPDAMIVCNRDIIRKDGIYGTPDLIVEILSPSTAKKDRGYKKDLYEKCGVKEYWIVEIESRSIEVYLLKDRKFELSDVYSIYPDYIIKKIREDEKNNIVYEFKTSLYDDMVIVLDDVFKNILI